MHFYYRTMQDFCLNRRCKYPGKCPRLEALYAFDCCSESLVYAIGFRAIIIITEEPIIIAICCDCVYHRTIINIVLYFENFIYIYIVFLHLCIYPIFIN